MIGTSWYWIAVLAPAGILAAAVLALARRYFAIVGVSGLSMMPTLRPGDRVLVRRGVRGRLLVGTMIVFRAPGEDDRMLIKRVAALPGDPVPQAVRPAVDGTAVVPPGMVVTLGDNPGGIDSRTWGFVPVADVVGRVLRLVEVDRNAGNRSAGLLSGARKCARVMMASSQCRWRES